MKFKDFWDKCEEGYCHKNHWIYISDEEHKRFYSTFQLPITTKNDAKIWFDKNGMIHRIDGPAITYIPSIVKGYGCQNNDFSLEEIPLSYYYIADKEISKNKWLKMRKPYVFKQVYFLREKILTLRKLIEIPELFQEVYYEHKKKLLSLLERI